jgi:hypothetical protein
MTDRVIHVTGCRHPTRRPVHRPSPSVPILIVARRLAALSCHQTTTGPPLPQPSTSEGRRSSPTVATPPTTQGTLTSTLDAVVTAWH